MEEEEEEAAAGGACQRRCGESGAGTAGGGGACRCGVRGTTAQFSVLSLTDAAVTGATAALSRFPPPLMFPSESSEAVCGCQVHPFTSISFYSFFVPLSSRLPILECRVTAAAERL